ncbi:thioesterase II family protein [Kitasatospora xanthocidica]|uniref:thioesterase II family protein n=1 Tax=Kitasatospora xanthocidica TaxID=83382 RepID=UPI0036E19D90
MTGTAVVCLPPSGAGRSFYRGWPRRIDEAAVRPMSLAGHEERMRDVLPGSVGEAAADIADRVLALDAGRVVLFGHSLGAAVAYETAALLADRPGAPRLAVVLSARQAPGGPSPVLAALDGDDRALLDTVSAWGGMPPGGADGELAALLAPVLRADLAMSAGYTEPGGPLRVPVTVVGYREDTVVPLAEVGRWSALCEGPYRDETLAGGHFAAKDAPEELIGLVREALERTAD